MSTEDVIGSVKTNRTNFIFTLAFAQNIRNSIYASMQAPRQPILLALLISITALKADLPSLSVTSDPTSDSLTLSSQGSSAASHRIEHSRSLNEWWPVFAIRDSLAWSWDWDQTKESPASQFRLVDVSPPAIATHASWKNQIVLPSDPFLL